MRHRMTILTIIGLLVLAGGCGFSTKTAIGKNSTDSIGDSFSTSSGSPDTASSSDTGSSDSSSSDTGSSDSGYSGSGYSDSGYSDSGYSDSGYSDSYSSDSYSSDYSSSTSSPNSTTGGVTHPLPGWTPSLENTFVTACEGGDPAKSKGCLCTIHTIESTIPLSTYLQNPTSAEILDIAKRCFIAAG